MEKLHYTELFYSIQGEGRYMGVPSIFLRTFGCNFRCKKFNLPRDMEVGKYNPEVIPIINTMYQYKDFKDLPLVNTGCDTYASIYPEFRRFAKHHTPTEVVDSMLPLLPEGKWNDEHLVITGGEPLLGWQQLYPRILDDERMMDLKELTFETNGTQKLSEGLEMYLKIWQFNGDFKFREVTFSVSPKLSISGEKWEEAIKPEVVAQYQDVGYTYLKFVVANEADMVEAEKAVKLYREAGFNGPVYLMPCGGTMDPYTMNATNVAKLALSKGWRYSDRLQVPLFKNAWGT